MSHNTPLAMLTNPRHFQHFKLIVMPMALYILWRSLAWPQTIWMILITLGQILIGSHQLLIGALRHMSLGLPKFNSVWFSAIFAELWTKIFLILLNRTENWTEQEWTGSLPFSSVQFSVWTGWTEFFFSFSMYSKFHRSRVRSVARWHGGCNCRGTLFYKGFTIAAHRPPSIDPGLDQWQCGMGMQQ